jgi:hypothetical protein
MAPILMNLCLTHLSPFARSSCLFKLCKIHARSYYRGRRWRKTYAYILPVINLENQEHCSLKQWKCYARLKEKEALSIMACKLPYAGLILRFSQPQCATRPSGLDCVRHLQLGVVFLGLDSASAFVSGGGSREPSIQPDLGKWQRAALITTPRRTSSTCCSALCRALCRPHHPNSESLLTYTSADNVARTVRRYCQPCRRHSCRLTCVQCVRPARNTRCERCIRFKHHCDPGKLSNRGQQSKRRRSLHLDSAETMIAIPGDAIQTAIEMYELFQDGDQESMSPYSETTSESMESSGISSRNGSLDASPEMSEDSDFDLFSNSAIACAITGNYLDVIEPPMHRLSPDSLKSLTNLRPSRLRTRTTFESRLENRIVRLWDSYEAFALADARSGVLSVTSLFASTFSELFRWSRQLAEDGVC